MSRHSSALVTGPLKKRGLVDDGISAQPYKKQHAQQPLTAGQKLVFLHVEVPHCDWAAPYLGITTGPAPHTPNYQLLSPPTFKGPSIFTLQESLQNQPNCEGRASCRILSFFGMFLWNGWVVCSLYANMKVVPMSCLSNHLDDASAHMFSVHQMLGSGVHKAPQKKSFFTKKEDIVKSFVVHVFQCCSIPLEQHAPIANSSNEVSNICSSPPGIS
jgi:hypothetical protein